MIRMTAWFLLIAATAPALSEPVGGVVGDRDGSMVVIADAFDRAQLTQDGPALEGFVDDGLIFIDSSGTRRDKQAFIAGWTGKGDRYEPIVLIDRTFTRLTADAWIVGAEVTLNGVSDGKSFSSRFRFADTFKWTNGRWRAVHIQVTPIK